MIREVSLVLAGANPGAGANAGAADNNSNPYGDDVVDGDYKEV